MDAERTDRRLRGMMLVTWCKVMVVEVMRTHWRSIRRSNCQDLMDGIRVEGEGGQVGW